jgi:hypothetical protein
MCRAADENTCGVQRGGSHFQTVTICNDFMVRCVRFGLILWLFCLGEMGLDVGKMPTLLEDKGLLS